MELVHAGTLQTQYLVAMYSEALEQLILLSTRSWNIDDQSISAVPLRFRDDSKDLKNRDVLRQLIQRPQRHH
jgi:hypothetical protein